MRKWRQEVEQALKRVFTENKGLKLTALVIALGLFTAVRAQEKQQQWVDVEVEFIAPDRSTGLTVTTSPLSTVRVQLRGRATVLKAIREAETNTVKMDLSGQTRPGLITFFFEPEMFSFEEVEIVEVKPTAVPVRVEKLVTRRLPVEVKTVGRLKEGTEWRSPPSVTPAWVRATGPASVIRSVTAVSTEEIGIDDLAEGPYREDVPLVPVEGLQFDEKRFTVRFEVVPRLLSRTFDSVPLEAPVVEGRQLRIRTDRVSAVLSGREEVVSRLAPESIVAGVTLTSEQLQRPGRHRVPVFLRGLPDGMDVKSVLPAEVDVDISISN